MLNPVVDVFGIGSSTACFLNMCCFVTNDASVDEGTAGSKISFDTVLTRITSIALESERFVDISTTLCLFKRTSKG